MLKLRDYVLTFIGSCILGPYVNTYFNIPSTVEGCLVAWVLSLLIVALLRRH